jgi:hypothetical protein
MIRIIWAANAVWDMACVGLMLRGGASPHASMWRDMAVFEARRPLAIACVGGWGTLRALGALHFNVIAARMSYLIEASLVLFIIRELDTLKAVAVIGMSLAVLVCPTYKILEVSCV